ncbi:MAG TPA: FAD-dependent oxidoreductase, partial [Gemmatimonadales bacterium]|nr:FAD-dependent oxidoreductase [Gemmatimonadales bacterium]
LAGRIPLIGSVRESAVCLYTNTPSGDFLLDRHPGDPRVILASPCSGHGFKFAPVLGEVIADLVEERAPRFDLTPFRLERFLRSA